jgi:hypothetical protein
MMLFPLRRMKEKVAAGGGTDAVRMAVTPVVKLGLDDLYAGEDRYATVLDEAGSTCRSELEEYGSGLWSFSEGTGLPDLAALTTHPYAAVRGNALHAFIQCPTDVTSLREITARMSDDEDPLVVWLLSKLRLRLDNPF